MKSGSKIILISFCSLLLIIAAVFGLAYFGPAYQTVRTLKQNECPKAVEKYEKVNTSVQKELMRYFLPGALEDINQAFNAGKRNYEDTVEIYNTVNSFDEASVAAPYYDLFQRLVASKQAYETASNALDNVDYLLAFTWYEKVVPEDSLYKDAQAKLASAESAYVSVVKETFYNHVRRGDYVLAQECLSDARSVISNSTLENLQANLNNNVYQNVNLLLNNTDKWEKVELSSGYQGICIEIRVSTNSSRYFECIYCPEYLYKDLNSFTSFSGPCINYEIVGGRIVEMDYADYKNLQFGYSRDWDYSATEEVKMARLESLFD